MSILIDSVTPHTPAAKAGIRDGEAPWCSWPQREGLVLAMMMPWQFMMFISRWMERFISSTMCWITAFI